MKPNTSKGMGGRSRRGSFSVPGSCWSGKTTKNDIFKGKHTPRLDLEVKVVSHREFLRVLRALDSEHVRSQVGCT